MRECYSLFFLSAMIPSSMAKEDFFSWIGGPFKIFSGILLCGLSPMNGACSDFRVFFVSVVNVRPAVQQIIFPRKPDVFRLSLK
jgi:hypothetical protein